METEIKEEIKEDSEFSSIHDYQGAQFLPEATTFKDEIKNETEENTEIYERALSGFVYDPADVKDDNLSAIIAAGQSTDFYDLPSTSNLVISRPGGSITRVVNTATPCLICGELFKFRFQLENHTREKHLAHVGRKGENPPLKVQELRTDQTWRGHTKLEGCFYVEKRGAKRETMHPGTITYLQCGVCGEKFANARDHRTHAIKSHPDHPEECLCKNEYCERMRAVQSAPKEESAGDKASSILSPMYDPLRCPMCTEQLQSFFDLYAHYIKEHSREYALRFKCTGCEHVYTSPKGLKKHILLESGESDKCSGGASIVEPTRRRKRLADSIDNI